MRFGKLIVSPLRLISEPIEAVAAVIEDVVDDKETEMRKHGKGHKKPVKK